MKPPDRARASLDAWRKLASRDPLQADPHLRALLTRGGLAGLLPELSLFAGLCAGSLDAMATETNRSENLPRLTRYDGRGNRTEGVTFHPEYHQMGRDIYATGVMSRYRTPGRETESLAFVYLLSQNGEAGHTCPLACTAGMIKMLQRAPEAPADWLTRLLDPSYDQHFHGSQFLTEVQGGSDVGANAVRATPTGTPGWYHLTGEKWFCSVVDAGLFLVSARDGDGPSTAGVSAFVVPRHLADGTPNGFRIRRLKDKLGTRSMASAELDFEGAVGYRVGDFKDVVSIVLNTSRLYNAVAACGILQRALREADAYARTRAAFGVPILTFPAVARKIADLRAEVYGARAVTFELAMAADRIATGSSDEAERQAWRMLVNLNKYWTATAATRGALAAIEVLGGNGAIEDFSVLPRLLRDSVVYEAWEGGHNVLLAQVLRDAQRLGLDKPMFGWLRRRTADHPALDHVQARWRQMSTRTDAAALVRPLADELRIAVQCALLDTHARDGRDALEGVAASHLLAFHADPLADTGLDARVAALTADS